LVKSIRDEIRKEKTGEKYGKSLSVVKITLFTLNT
jgi:hypothetical protein